MHFLASRVAMLPLLLLVACPNRAECERRAIQDADGNPNSCDLQACLDCASACGGVCSALESSPHVWICGEDSFSGGDFCDASEWPPGAAASADERWR